VPGDGIRRMLNPRRAMQSCGKDEAQGPTVPALRGARGKDETAGSEGSPLGGRLIGPRPARTRLPVRPRQSHPESNEDGHNGDGHQQCFSWHGALP
jgi:hypothetical protein